MEKQQAAEKKKKLSWLDIIGVSLFLLYGTFMATMIAAWCYEHLPVLAFVPALLAVGCFVMSYTVVYMKGEEDGEARK